MKLKTKIILKGLFHSILQSLLVLTFAWFNNCIFEMLTVYLCFFLFRTKFDKQYHALTSWGCTLITMIVFYVVSLIVPNKSISLLLVILFTYFINLMSFYVRDYLDLRDRFNAKSVKITRGIDKDKLLEICGTSELSDLEIKILVYFYCDRLSLTAISYKINYSYDYVAELKSKAIKKIKK